MRELLSQIHYATSANLSLLEIILLALLGTIAWHNRKGMSVYGCRVSGDPQKDGLRQLWREADTELGKEQDRTLGVSCVRNADWGY